MPNRIIKDSIHVSEKVNKLTDFQFRVWVNLITYVDDYGRGDARPAVIKGACFPFRDRITNKDIEAALFSLADTGCIGLYEVDGKSYLYFPNWESHQRVRQKISKHPAPPTCGNPPQLAATGGNMRQSAATCGLNPESRIQNPNPESESGKDVCAEPETGSAPAASSGHMLPLNDGSMYDVPQDDVAHYRALYPAVDVDQQLRAMIGWLEANPTRRKTRKGIKNFIANWLNREQNRSGGGSSGVHSSKYDPHRPEAAQGYQQRDYTDEELNSFILDVMHGEGDD